VRARVLALLIVLAVAGFIVFNNFSGFPINLNLKTSSSPTFVMLHGFRGMHVRMNLNTVQSYEENTMDAEEQKTLLLFIDGNSQTVMETPDQVDALINKINPITK
jgi:hypothetical protein